MLVGVAVLAVIAPAAEPGESRAEAAPPALSAADAPAPRFALVPLVGSPVHPAVARLGTARLGAVQPGAAQLRAVQLRAAQLGAAQLRAAQLRAAQLGVQRGVARSAVAGTATVRTLRSRNRTVASRSAVRRPVRPPLVAQRFTHSAVAKLSAAPPAAKPRPRSTGPGRTGGPGRRYGGDARRPGAGARTTVEGGGLSAVIAYAWGQVGKSYVSGAEGPYTFDCSGLTMQAYKRAGIHLPHSSGAQAAMARTVSRAEAVPGDLVVGPGHVGIYLGNGMMIDAGNSRVGVVYREMYDGLHIERFL